MTIASRLHRAIDAAQNELSEFTAEEETALRNAVERFAQNESRIAELEQKLGEALDDARRSYNMVSAFQFEMMEIRNLSRKIFNLAGGREEGEGE